MLLTFSVYPLMVVTGMGGTKGGGLKSTDLCKTSRLLVMSVLDLATAFSPVTYFPSAFNPTSNGKVSSIHATNWNQSYRSNHS
jgi:hypothetical protein